MLCHRSFFAGILTLLVACNTPSGNTTDSNTTGSETTGDTTAGPSEGQALYQNPVEGGNTFACATCHALHEPADDAMRRPGHPIGNATRRATYKNGQLTDMRQAVNSCLQEWMLADAWSEEDPRWQTLVAWLDAQATVETADPLAFTITQPPGDLSGGDAAKGQTLFNQSCSVCHGTDAIGTNLAPSIAGQNLDPSYIGQRVRTSGVIDSPIYEGLTGGRMPFWSAQRLTDDELRDLAAWVQGSESPGTDTDTTGTTDSETETESESDSSSDTDTTTTGSDCGMTHPWIGRTATLEQKFHDVGGTAEIVDDCTIVISNFTYDGTGIDVRIYGGQDGNYQGGFAMTEDLLKPGGYNGVTLVATVPEGASLDEMNGISVWCVDVGVDFGSGLFTP